MNYEGLNDTQLWKLISADDRKAFGYSFTLYSKDLFRYGQKFTGARQVVEDSIQDVFLDLWHKRKTTNIEQSIKFYLFTAFRREIIRKLSKLRQQEPMDYFAPEQLLEASHMEGIILQQGKNESNQQLYKAIRNLSERQREAVYLRFFANLNYKEISGMMGISVEALYNLIFKSIKILKESLRESVQYQTK
ncbi:RNA polymerase sigma factor [Echinicola vietnamensis]|uniref:RNA polymerase sigma factor, sigma-70 family n=1 Tax=Echinicola vietnamensis (strain DSM 17526 / LMG 23754 / KMM 6221) TaxID=926556 RepID=L0FX43_ECHVK|nr:sigma-70 family RNA polymerase sigma factor [Echinicola vietnamensis]AGA77593.1 RNA polymerase sigma factor, sigma-70 family [Echinicola vietnamensis DSM 17526]